MPTFSVVTVSFNAADTIRETLESVRDQRAHADIEHIVVDGGSTDSTVEVIREYESELAWWVSEPDGGIYDAMNKGLARAEGEWIGTLNADDWYAQDAFRHVAALARSFPDSDILIGGMVRVSDDGRLGKIKPAFRGGFSTLKSNNHPATFVRRSIYESVGPYDVRYRVAADLDWLAKAMEDSSIKIARTDEVVTFMRGGGASANFVGVFESFQVEREHRGIGTAVAILGVKSLKMAAYKLAYLLLPDRTAHALERAYWRWRFDTLELDRGER